MEERIEEQRMNGKVTMMVANGQSQFQKYMKSVIYGSVAAAVVGIIATQMSKKR